MGLFKKMSKKEKYYNDKVNNIEIEINEMFSEVISNEPVANERLELMLEKVLLLKTYLENINFDIENYNSVIRNKSKKYSLIKLITLFVAWVTIFINYKVFLVSYIIYTIFNIKDTIDLNNLVSQNMIDKLETQSKALNNTLFSCYNFIIKRMQENNIDVSEVKNEDLSYEHAASYIIDVYLKTGKLVEMTANLKNYVVVMLQRSLNTSEKDLTVLLDQIKSKISEKDLAIDHSRTRNKDNY